MSSTVNQNFDKAVQCFKEELEQIISSGILPIDVQTSAADKKITEDSLRSSFENSINEKFTIAVCGEVKAGKSTLLNALIFEEEKLPSFVTPETAKLTFIRESEKDNDYFKVHWYSVSEWNEMRDSLPEENKNALDARLEYSASMDVTPFNCIGKDPWDVNELNRLAEFTSVPKEGEGNPKVGVYTPFVKYVEIYIKSDMVKNLQIVDTPGLNDPNRINSNETTKWINQAHAIIYVFPVRGLGASDLEFFKTFMPAKTLKTRILVQNRIDENKDYKNAIAGYEREPAYLDVGLFVPGEIVCPYSAQLNLSYKKKKQGKASTRDEKFLKRHPEITSNENIFDPNDLKGKISSRLYKNSGYARIETFSNICCSVYSAKVKNIQESIKLLQYELKNFDEPSERVKEKLKRLMDDKQNILDEIDKIKAKLNENLDKQKADLKTYIHTAWSNLDFAPEIRRLVSLSGGYKNVQAEFPRIWDIKMNEIKLKLEKFINTKVKDVQKEMSKKQAVIVEKISAVMGENVREIIVDYSKENWDVTIDSDLKSLGLPSGFWDNLITRGSVVADNIITVVNEQILKIKKSYESQPIIITQRISNCAKKTLDEIVNKTQFIENTLKNVLGEEQGIQAKKDELNQNIQNAKDMEAKCTQKIKDIKQLLMKLA